MTRANRVSVDPIDALVEIMQTINNRLEKVNDAGNAWSAAEAFTLGMIMGTACRCPWRSNGTSDWSMLMTDQDFDVIGTKGHFRWVWNNPRNAEQRIGPEAHKTKAAALNAGREWLAAKQAR